MTEQPETRRVPADWSVAALHAAGAESVTEVREENNLVGLEVSPPVSDQAYQAANLVITKASLLAYAGDLRWRREVGGISIAGVPVATDDRAKMMILGARVAAMADPSWSTIWHGADGGTYPVDAAAMVAISDAVQTHVNQGFATFASVKAAIEVGTITSFAEIEGAFS